MTRSVLLIEDEPTLAKNIRAYLGSYDFDVRVATTAESGLSELEAFKPDIVLLDFNLPGMNGMEALAKIRAIGRQLKVIMMTAHGSIDLAAEAMRAGAYNFITKPIALGKLRLLLEQAFQDERRDQAPPYRQIKANSEGGLQSMLGGSDTIPTLERKIPQIVEGKQNLRDADAPAVLIKAETGTGNEVGDTSRRDFHGGRLKPRQPDTPTLDRPPASASRTEATPRFNFSRWFAIDGLVSIGVVSAASALLLSHLLTDSMLQQEGQMTTQFVQSLVMTEKSLAVFLTGEKTRDATELQLALRHIAAVPDSLRASIYNREHELIWSTDPKLVGRKFEANPELEAALAGQLVVHGDAKDDAGKTHKEEHVNVDEQRDYFVDVYVPVRDAPRGTVIGVVEMFKNPKALGEALHTGRLYIFAGAAVAGLILYLVLLGLSRRADAAIRTQRERLLQSEILTTVGEMGSAVAHGIRSPLAIIRSSAELALDGPPELARESARDIIAEANRPEAWVRDLLSYTRPLTGADAAVALPALVDDAIKNFAQELEKRDISGSSTLARDLPPAKGDSILLGQVLHSLLANAVEAIEKGGTIEFVGKTVPAQHRVELTIFDSGPGMTADQLKRVFTPFYTTKARGLGFGLALAKRIVERFGGTILIDSAPGRGTAVCLSMPIA